MRTHLVYISDTYQHCYDWTIRAFMKYVKEASGFCIEESVLHKG